ncbi:MAG: molybdenum cofactor biosynthesis protein MoaE [Candidatus Obscuribacterales bacterium]|nr:molybdenum cofactor biosynthesis protein MoaE [Candidatus Obscuribacterales bacterium]
MFSLSEQPIVEFDLKQSVQDVRAGAICVFEGRVRNHNDGKAVEKLSYEAYAELCVNEAARILAETRDNFDVLHIAVLHRVGDLAINDVAVCVAVSSVHRDDAFKACRYLIDEIKARLPIWKRETYADGSVVWVNCQFCANNTHSSYQSVVAQPQRSNV